VSTVRIELRRIHGRTVSETGVTNFAAHLIHLCFLASLAVKATIQRAFTPMHSSASGEWARFGWTLVGGRVSANYKQATLRPRRKRSVFSALT